MGTIILLAIIAIAAVIIVYLVSNRGKGKQ